jgi:hypothetical protein
LLRESLPSDVQPSLDRAYRRLKRCAHLRERFATHIKRFQRVAIKLAKA